MKTLHTFLLTLSFCIMLASTSLDDMNTISMESVDTDDRLGELTEWIIREHTDPEQKRNFKP